MRISLHRALLTYGGGLVLHTASSGRIAALDTLYLRLDDGETVAVGEVRLNIAYLNGLDPEQVLAEAVAVVGALDFSSDAPTLLAEPPAVFRAASAPVRMLIDGALHDRAATRAGLPLARFLGAPAETALAHTTNQTLFVSDEVTFLAQAEAYVARGFRDLKVRIGAGDIGEDLRRIALLRARFGKAVKIAADANGAWSEEAARGHLAALAAHDLAYVEQPIAPGDWAALDRLARVSPLPIMLDESVKGLEDVDRIAASGNGLMAHLKLVKLGGIAPTLAAARRLNAAGVPFMIGQMNEGGLATAAALHVALATGPRFAELYGADGLTNDPAPGLAYTDGRVAAPDMPGLGLTFDAHATHLIKEFS
ncbi:mandelate racemase/muconate lactonizing enzyme family protein [Ancylobacter sp. WKF20]|uniref:mandelate racemase/muconate lactonizing enzyme family protein n=1 Tax=Ancylobacter sp. WKF20 TaxID=3039801 RepID=UPI0024340C73|nr:mandelate racemase/muconate lactonizing enzyme family protein [Ancylobacter sp. WKF20]WGD32206.1 mandelate racemase/muconate lactonizing enzyme family protein [Ancylobacter sp. WKF20]